MALAHGPPNSRSLQLLKITALLPPRNQTVDHPAFSNHPSLLKPSQPFPHPSCSKGGGRPSPSLEFSTRRGEGVGRQVSWATTLPRRNTFFGVYVKCELVRQFSVILWIPRFHVPRAPRGLASGRSMGAVTEEARVLLLIQQPCSRGRGREAGPVPGATTNCARSPSQPRHLLGFRVSLKWGDGETAQVTSPLS